MFLYMSNNPKEKRKVVLYSRGWECVCVGGGGVYRVAPSGVIGAIYFLLGMDALLWAYCEL